MVLASRQLKLGFFLLNFLFSWFLFGQIESDDLKDISGKITNNGNSLAEVNISVQNTRRGTITDVKGNYQIKAKVGETIVYSHIGFKTVKILVEDVTKTLNLDLIEKANELETTIVMAKRKDNTESLYEKKMNVDLQLPFGTLNPLKSGFSVNYVAGDELNAAASSLAWALSGKASNVIVKYGELHIRGNPASYIIDGKDATSISGLNISNIEDVYIIKNSATVVIRTKFSPQVAKEKNEQKLEKLKNENFYENDAIGGTASDQVNGITNPNLDQGKLRKIKGHMTHFNSSVAEVLITVLGTDRSTLSDKNGKYSIKAKPGETLRFSHIKFKAVDIIVEDVTKELNIEMVDKTNLLDQVTVTRKTKNGDFLEKAIKAETPFNTAYGEMDPKKSGFSMSYIEGKNLNQAGVYLIDAIRNKFPGVQVGENDVFVRGLSSPNTPPAIWDVDGLIFENYDQVPLINLADVKEIRVLKSLAASSRYGHIAAGGVVVVTTVYGDLSNRNTINTNLQNLTNKDFYKQDATNFSAILSDEDGVAQRFKDIDNVDQAFIIFQEYKSDFDHFSDYLIMANLFYYHYKRPNKARDILLELKQLHLNNPEILKAIAYHFQDYGNTREAAKILEQVYKLRPTYAQSYRDLGNAYMEDNQFVMAWRLYMSYLLNRETSLNNALGDIIYNEMEYLYFNRPNQTNIKQNFLPKNKTLSDFRNDIRIVAEWNTSEAEFDLEFVAPDQRAYVFEHSLEDNQELISEEKSIGFSSKEFFIDKVGFGEWLMNLTYQGNKQSVPTVFKISIYYNWGQPNQRKETQVFAAIKQDTKVQLAKINKSSLLAEN